MASKWLNLFTGAALSFSVAGNAQADDAKITVFAAASLTNERQDIATQYKKEKGVDVVSSFASSSTLARQIEAGAHADLFISADQKWMDYAVDKKAIDTATRQTLLGNSLVVVAAGNAQADDAKITVFAAASLTNERQDIATQYKKEKGVDVVSSFASSSTLARQIEAGAHADLFISADQKWMDYAVDKKAIDTATRQTLLGNSLVVVAPKDSEQKDFNIDTKTNFTSLLNVDKKAIDTASRQTLLGNSLVVVAPKASEQKDFTIDSKTNWTSLLNGGRLAVGDPEHVPAGIYAKEALQKLGAWDTLSPKLAPAEDVRGALALVERNEAPLGIVYGSDAVASKGVNVVAFIVEESLNALLVGNKLFINILLFLPIFNLN